MTKKDTKIPKKAATAKAKAKKPVAKKVAKKEPDPKATERKISDPLMVNKSHIKEYIGQKEGIRISPSIFTHLSKLVESMCDKAIERAKDNGRRTIQKQDF